MKATRLVTSLLELLGMLVAVVGVALFDWRAGLIALGAVMVLLGYTYGVDSE